MWDLRPVRAHVGQGRLLFDRFRHESWPTGSGDLALLIFDEFIGRCPE